MSARSICRLILRGICRRIEGRILFSVEKEAKRLWG
jgi:hypothetical protein